jgi:hypothetical protein
MTLDNLRCTSCYNLYSSRVDCPVCEQAKYNIKVDEKSDDDLSVEKNVDHVLVLLRRNLRYLDSAMTAQAAAGKKYAAGAFNGEHAKYAVHLSKAIIATSAEVRQMRKDQSDLLKNMSLDDKAQLFLDFLEEMPFEDQKLLIKKAVLKLEAFHAAPALLEA